MKIVKLTHQHLDEAVVLFDGYRQFYEQPSDLVGCRTFLVDNLEQGRSDFFLLLDASETPVAFSQLYPMFCSTAMRKFYYLSDLYVDVAQRGHGYSRLLMRYLIEHYRALGVHRLTLETARTNVTAQNLYGSLGYQRDEVFLTYHYAL